MTEAPSVWLGTGGEGHTQGISDNFLGLSKIGNIKHTLNRVPHF